MLILYLTETHVKENNMWFGNVILIVGIIGVAFSGTYIQAIMFAKITIKQSIVILFVFLITIA